MTHHHLRDHTRLEVGLLLGTGFEPEWPGYQRLPLGQDLSVTFEVPAGPKIEWGWAWWIRRFQFGRFAIEVPWPARVLRCEPVPWDPAIITGAVLYEIDPVDGSVWNRHPMFFDAPRTLCALETLTVRLPNLTRDAGPVH